MATPPAARDDWRTGQPPRPSWPTGWQIAIVVLGWPLWWAAGVTQFVFPALGIYLAWKLSRLRKVMLPDGFWLWGLFLLLVLVSAVAIDVPAAGTVSSAGIGRYLAFVFRFLNYLAITLVMVYVGNLSERELPRRRVIGWMAGLGVMTIIFGLLAVAFPSFGFSTVLSYVAPSSLTGVDGAVAKLAQVQPILGASSPRPAAPFAYTNAWGNNLSLLLVWIVVAGITLGSRRRRVWTGVLLAAAVVPIIYSLNRGMWTGIILSMVVVAVRLAVRGRVLVLCAVAAIICVAALAFALTPLQSMVQARLDAGHSNDVRQSLAYESLHVAGMSPLIGFGSTRQTQGSDASIAIGPSPDCPRCGAHDIGSTGQFWLLLIAQGFLGAALYVGFLVRSLWAYRSDSSVLGIAGTLVVLLELYYGLYYSALTMPLAVTMLTIGLLWRNQQVRRAAGAT